MIPFLQRVPEDDRRAYSIDAVAASYYGLFVGFAFPFVPILLKRLGATPLQMGIALAAPFLSLVLSFPLYRYFGRCKAIDLVTVPTIFSRLSIGLIGLFPSVEAVLLIYLFCQLVEGFGLSPYSCVLKKMYTDRGRSVSMGYVRTMLCVFQILASALGGYMLDRGHIILLFGLAGIAGAISSLNFRRIFKNRESPEFAAQPITMKDVVRTNRQSEGFRWLNASIMLFGFGNLIMLAILPTMLVDRFNISNASIGNLTSLSYLSMMISYAFIGRFNTKHGAHRGLILGLGAGTVNPLLYLVSPGIAYLTIPYTLFGVSIAGFDLSWNVMILGFAPPAEIAAYSAVYTFFMGIRGVTAMMLSNLFLPFWGAELLLLVAGAFTLAGLLVALLKRGIWKAS